MKALALVDGPDHVCCRYRVRAYEPALAAAGWSLTIEGLAEGALGRLKQTRAAGGFDAVILQRKLLPGWQLDALRKNTKHLVFDFDDAVLYRDSYDARGPHCKRRAARFARTMRAADTVVAGNDFLADCALRNGARPEQVRVIPTAIAPERYPVAVHRARGADARLVWIGSSSTLQGLEQQKALWNQVGLALPGIRLRLIGDRSADLGALGVEFVAWSEATEAADVAAADIAVSWMPDDLWSRGKCGLKVLQYQAAGLPVVANPVGVHAEMVEPGLTGYLPESAEGWVDAIRKLAGEPELRMRMGQEARASVVAGYSVGAWASTFVATIAGTRPAPTPAPKFGSLRAADARASKGASARNEDLVGPMHKRHARRAGRTTETRLDESG